MSKIYLLSFTVFTLLTSLSLSAQAPVITSAVPLSTSIEQWGKFEVKLAITAAWVNPYDYNEIRVAAIFTAPNGTSFPVDGFFIQEYGPVNTQTGAITPVGSGVFKVRFSPNQPGAWTYTLSCTNANGTGTFTAQSFQVTPAASPLNQGFVRSNQTNYLNFDAGDQYIPVGENIGWQSSNVYLDYSKWLTDLSSNGGNFFRLWQSSWGLGIEWKNGVSGYAGLRKYKQSSAFYQDWLFDYCTEKGIYIELCLHNHGQVSTQVNPEWTNSPYNVNNGGPCANTWDFFTNANAKAHVKNRLRYIVARWGYARSILNWELFNEVDWTDQFEQRKGEVAAWHDEMSAYLKEIDPYKHLVSTSYAHDFNDPNVWNLPYMDFAQTHFYINTANLERAISNSTRKYLADFGKPVLNAEFGINGSGEQLVSLDPNGIYIHNALWGGLFGGSMGSSMTWWWDNYIAPQNLYYHFAAVSNVAAQVPFQAGNYSPAASTITSAAADLLLQPTQGWGALTDTSITISNGMVLPEGAILGQFLYGSQWNTQLRRPPVFYMNYPANGTFKVNTATESGQAPKIAIWLDGVQILNQNAAVNQAYSINVPAGPHTIKVDNTGTDWITISNYNFSGLGSSVDAYVLKSVEQDALAGWVLSNRYNHEFIKANGAPTPVSGALLTVPNLQNGAYLLSYYDCLLGNLLSSEPQLVSNGTLSLVLPTLLWDLAFTLTKTTVNTVETSPNLAFNLFPNPATAGALLTLDFGDHRENQALSIDLLDVEGRTIQSLPNLENIAGQPLNIPVPAALTAGFYWLKITQGDGQTAVKGLVIVDKG